MLVCDCPPCPSPFSSTVLADLQQADLITSEECSRLSHISRVLEVQRTKSPEVVTKTADVIKRHGYVQESSLLPGELLSLLAAA